MKGRAIGAGLGVAAAGLLVGWVPGAAAAGPGVVSGWWQQANQTPVPAPADPSTPPDGMQVTTTAAGVVAIGAVRFVVQTPGTDAVLTLRVATGTATSPSGDLVVHACPTTNAWKPVQNGPWSARPLYKETACITGQPASDQRSVTFAVPASAQRNGAVDLAIEALSSAPVTLAFAHPVPGDLVVTAPAGPGVAPTAIPPALPADAGSSAAADTPPSQAAVVAPDAAQSIGPGLSAPVAAPSAPTALAAPVRRAATVTPSQVFTPAAVSALPAADRRSTRIAAVALLLGIGMALWWFGGQPVRAPRMIGNLGGRMGATTVVVAPAHEVRGVGRFARPRDPGHRPGRG